VTEANSQPGRGAGGTSLAGLGGSSSAPEACRPADAILDQYGSNIPIFPELCALRKELSPSTKGMSKAMEVGQA
jgi:hypothetical protein